MDVNCVPAIRRVLNSLGTVIKEHVIFEILSPSFCMF